MKRNQILHHLAKGQLIWGWRLLWVPLSVTQRHSAAKFLSFLSLPAVKHKITSYQPSPCSDNLLSNPGLSGIYSLDFVRKRTKTYTRSMISNAPETAHTPESSEIYEALFNCRLVLSRFFGCCGPGTVHCHVSPQSDRKLAPIMFTDLNIILLILVKLPRCL